MNGLLIAEHQRLVLVDTPASAAATAELLTWAELELQQPVSRVVFTHAEESALAGARFLDERHIPLVALSPTAARLSTLGAPRVTSLGDLAPGASVRIGTIELYYPGLDHRRDAILVWLRDARLLYGSCVVKPPNSGPLPPLSASERQSWAAAIRRVLQRFPDTSVVVTMEGEPGGPDLLQYTLRLLAAAAP